MAVRDGGDSVMRQEKNVVATQNAVEAGSKVEGEFA